jgi:hypothetical protein
MSGPSWPSVFTRRRGRPLTWDQVDLAAGLINFGSVDGGQGRAVVPIAASFMPYLADARKAAISTYVVEHGSKPVGSVKTGIRAAARGRRWPESRSMS